MAEGGARRGSNSTLYGNDSQGWEIRSEAGGEFGSEESGVAPLETLLKQEGEDAPGPRHSGQIGAVLEDEEQGVKLRPVSPSSRLEKQP